MKRRGFLGALAAIVVAPKALLARKRPPKVVGVRDEYKWEPGIVVHDWTFIQRSRYQRLHLHDYQGRRVTVTLQESDDQNGWRDVESLVVPRPFRGVVRFTARGTVDFPVWVV